MNKTKMRMPSTLTPKLDEVVKAPNSPTVETEVVDVTPETAKSWLRETVGNRNLSRGKLEEYKRSMAEGRWLLTGEAIIFNTQGKLINGHHRLQASIASRCTFRTLVVRNVPEEAFLQLDTGRSRQFADYLRWSGDPNVVVAAGIARTLWHWENGSFRDRGTGLPVVSISELMNFYRQRRDGIQASARIAQGTVSKAPLYFRASASGALHFRLSSVYPEDTPAFFEALASGANLDDQDPIYRLRLRLIHMAQQTKASFEGREYLALGIKAWNAWIKGQVIQQLVWRSGGATPEPFPEIVMPEAR